MANHKKRRPDQPAASTERILKPKLDGDISENRDEFSFSSDDDLIRGLRAQIKILESSFYSTEADRASAKRAIHVISVFAKIEENVDLIVGSGVVPVLVKYLEAPPPGNYSGPIAYEHAVEKGSAFTLALLATKPEHQQLIVDTGALPHLVNLLKRHKDGQNSPALNGVIRRAADAITNLAHEDRVIKTLARNQGAIPPLVELLEFADAKVQIAAAGALRTLAYQNDENKNQIVECGALPTLILMMQSKDAAVHSEAVGVIGNLVHSSPNIKKVVLEAGALQPVIRLLSSCCSESQREAALLLGQFAATDTDCKVHIVQRGAVSPLVKLLQSSDDQIKEMSAFALGRLAQDMHNQAGISHCGGIMPLLNLLDSDYGLLQHNAAFALYCLAYNEDNVAELVAVGGAQKLQDGQFLIQPTRDCVAKTLKRLEEKVNGRVLSHLLYLMRVADKSTQRRVVLALAHLCSPFDQRSIFVDSNGLDLLLELLESPNPKHQQVALVALCKLAEKAHQVSPSDALPPFPHSHQIYLAAHYVNNPSFSDITFLIEGKRFYAHKICLLASSDAFRAMFAGGYRERDAKDIEIPNISWDIFELMMRYLYTGSVVVNLDVAHELLRAADQYLLDGLKRRCEIAIAEDISEKNVKLVYELSEDLNAIFLRHECIRFMLENIDKLIDLPWYSLMIHRILPEIRNYIVEALSRPIRCLTARVPDYP